MEADFGGYATKAGLKCSDGRTITPDAFKHMNGKRVPLVWQHGHDDPENVLGHAILEVRPDGVYARGFFNGTKQGLNAKALVVHKDIEALSIYANKLVERSGQVLHGFIKEVSLAIAGKNPGAFIDYVRVAHSDGEIEVLDDEAIIHTGLELELNPSDGTVEHSAEDPTVQEVFDTFTEAQRNVFNYVVGKVLETKTADLAQSDTENDDEDKTTEIKDDKSDEGDLTHKEEGTVVTNVFESGSQGTGEKHSLTHADRQAIFASAKKTGSLRAAFEEHMLAHGIDNIELLFPDAKAVTDRPDWDKRRTEWVAEVLNKTHKTPFSKIKTLTADITLDAARAKGYVKGSLKKEEFFGITKRTTGPTTVYKKQKLDRDDIIDITDFDVVAWMWGEMRLMLEEELARAILIGDGRAVDDEDKIKDPAAANSGDGIRSILHDHDYYAPTFFVNVEDSGSTYLEFVDMIIGSRRHYKGSGLPTMFTTEVVLAEMLTLRDGNGNRMFRTVADLATELRVSSIVPVEVMESETDVLAILVSLQDYNVGTNKGGEITTFDDFDIDYNQYKYLIETRLSGALIKLKSALIFKKTASTAVLTVPNAPTFVSSTGVVTIVATTGIVYKNKTTGATLSTGAQAALAAGASITVVAEPASSSYYIENTVQDEWTFTRDEA